MGLVVKVMGLGMGFASEAIHAYRDRGQQPPSLPDSTAPAASDPEDQAHSEAIDVDISTLSGSGHPDSTLDDTERSRHDSTDTLLESNLKDLSRDESAWELDDIAERVRESVGQEHTTVPADESEKSKLEWKEEMVSDLVSMAGPPQPGRRLPCPVIIPQRRPKKKQRGFVRAYAPVLADCGINEDTFLQFIDYLDEANKASKWIEIVYVAGAFVGCVPNATAMIVSTVVQVIAGTAKELQARHRENTFLGRVNQELLMPRGLYAMIMTFKDKVPGQQQGPLSGLSKSVGTLFAKEKLDIDQVATKYSNPDPNTSKFKKGLSMIRVSSGVTHGSLELPEAAALVYPDLDRAVALEAEDETSEGPQAALLKNLRGASEWVTNYNDRKAHASLEAKHPSSSLSLPADRLPPMKSRYNDPNHPANSGSVISLLTGGRVPVPGIEKTFSMVSKYVSSSRRGENKPSDNVKNGKVPDGLGVSVIKKVLQEDVLYLLVVNLPTQEEVKESVEQIENLFEQSEDKGIAKGT